MASQIINVYAVASIVIVTSVLMLRRGKASDGPQTARQPYPLASVPSDQLPGHIQSLLYDLPGQVILQSDTEAFQRAVDYSWAQQNREIIPACIVRPTDTQQLGKAVAVLKREHDRRNHSGTGTEGFFAVRSGGVNPGIGVATVKDGVLIDLSLFCSVTLAVDGSTVTIGTGAKWIDVYRNLDEKGLVVVGGRSSPVGVGGLALQGGISFYSPRFGFVCSNIVSYEVVLADGSSVTASAEERPDLWRVLKGSSGSFGIVTHFTMRCMPSAPVWVGRLFCPAAFQREKALRAYNDYLKHTGSSQSGGFDENAAGPIMSFIYIQRIGLELIVANLMYTKAPQDNKWPAYWKKTGFASLWNLYRSSKIQSHTSAVEQIASTSPAGTRHTQGTTTIRNDFETMEASYAIFGQAVTALRQVKGLLFPFTFQAILPGWMNKGDPNVLGLEGCKEPLIIISFAVTWANAKDDDLVRSTIRRTVEQINTTAAARQSDHPYRFMNYAMEWQQPYSGRGEQILSLLREASSKYDPDGLFQIGRAGGFKLPE